MSRLGPRFKLGMCVVILAGLTSGCATNRGVMPLEVPAASPGAPKGKAVVIRSVKDVRVFEDAPREPSIPSLKGGASEATDDIKRRAIARKRNGYGKALGDIVLPEGQTVETVVRAMLTNALTALGYEIKEDADAPGAIVLDTTIDRFWSWMTPGFWSLTIDADIKTTVDITHGGKQNKTVIAAAVQRHTQAAGTRAWKTVYGNTMDKYAQEAQSALGKNLP